MPQRKKPSMTYSWQEVGFKICPGSFQSGCSVHYTVMTLVIHVLSHAQGDKLESRTTMLLYRNILSYNRERKKTGKRGLTQGIFFSGPE